MLDDIDLLVLDVDGVLADGRIIYDSRGADTKNYHVVDGQGVKYWRRAGHEAAILSGRTSRTIRRRATEIGITAVFTGAKDKLPAFEKMLRRLGRTPDHVCYVGDDLVDIPVMARVGFAVATRDAAEEVRRLAHYVTRRSGGEGAVREVIELILKYQGRWDAVIERYRAQLPADLPPRRRPWRERP